MCEREARLARGDNEVRVKGRRERSERESELVTFERRRRLAARNEFIQYHNARTTRRKATKPLQRAVSPYLISLHPLRILLPLRLPLHLLRYSVGGLPSAPELAVVGEAVRAREVSGLRVRRRRGEDRRAYWYIPTSNGRLASANQRLVGRREGTHQVRQPCTAHPANSPSFPPRIQPSPPA